ncbi:MAG: tyrosine-type recombinase/integrase [Roseburia sp.]|nr:tyrosine-type recombinase/integrase [Roseburia sp.]
MGKSIKGKELDKGITQRKSDGLYQGRFVNRFGKTQTIYASNLNELRKKMREEQYEDAKALNVVTKDITLDEWYEIWMNTCKKNCRNSTKESYATHYKRIQKELGWRKLTSLNLIIMQNALNGLVSDNARKNTKKILVDMLEKAIDSDLLTKNVAKQLNTVISKEDKKERRVLTVSEAELFLGEAQKSFYHNLFVLALETGMRIGELCGLQWQDIDFEKKVLYVRHTLCYFRKDGKYIFEMHDAKTKNGRRTIPLTTKALEALRRQRIQKQKILFKGIETEEQYRDLVFVTKNNRPTQQFIVQEAISSVVNRICKVHSDYEMFSPHCLRHTFATRAIENGMQPKTLQKILGHGSLQMTMDLYCHVTEDTLFTEMMKMEKAG